MKITPATFNGFLLLCFLGMAYSFGVFGYFYQPEYKTNEVRTLEWSTADSTYTLSLRAPGTLKGFTVAPFKNSTPEAATEGYGLFFLNLRPNLLTWILIFTLFNGFCLAASGYLVPLTFRHTLRPPEYRNRLIRSLLLSVISIVAIFAIAEGIFIPRSHIVSPYQMWVMFPEVFAHTDLLIPIIQIPGYLLGLLCILAMITLGNVAIKQWGTSVEAIQERLRRINRLSHHLLIILSLVLALAVLTTFFLYRATLENVSGPTDLLFPDRILILYGTVFTFFILLFYLPTYFKVRQLNEEALEHARHHQLDTTLLIETTEKQLKLSNPRLLFTIASPVITSLFPSLVEVLSHL